MIWVCGYYILIIKLSFKYSLALISFKLLLFSKLVCSIDVTGKDWMKNYKTIYFYCLIHQSA